MSNPLTLGMLQDDVRTQMDASREVLGVARQLQEIAKASGDDARRAELESIVDKLADIGTKIVTNARSTGAKIVDLARAS